jgi:hypothetical protein
MIQVSKLQSGAPNPGFVQVPATSIAGVTEEPAIVKVKGTPTACTRLNFKGADGNVFAAIANVNNSLAWLKMRKHGNKRLGELIKDPTVMINFPAKGTLGSEPSLDAKGVQRTVVTTRGPQPAFDGFLDDVTIDELLVKA